MWWFREPIGNILSAEVTGATAAPSAVFADGVTLDDLSNQLGPMTRRSE